jgi:hypothetical protein
MANRKELEAAVNDGCAVEAANWPHPIRGTKAFNEAAKALGDDMEGVVIRDARGRLTREGMESHIKAGGSVFYEGRDQPITRVEDLPHPAELAKGDAKKMAAVESDLDRRQALLDAERKRVATAKQQAEEAARVAQKNAAAADEEVAEGFTHLSADELKALCDEHGCEVEGRPTKAKMAAALAAKGVTPPKE